MKKILFSILILIILGGVSSFLYIEWQIYRPLNQDGTLHDFLIEEGQGVKEIGGGLTETGIIRSSWYFEVYVWQKKRQSDFQAGSFRVSSSMNIPEVVRVLTGDPEPEEMEITIIEGWNRHEIDTYLKDKDLINEGDFIEETDNFEASILGGHYEAGDSASLEGFLFPDTYRIYKDAKPGSILKESASRDEMPLIAGVFYNRLDDDYFLESDATVNYVTGKGKRQPSFEDLEVDSFYNTYANRGLPPGPICNPGLAAIKAAINPENTDYYYFLHPEEGGTIFSKTLEEHNRNKAIYLD